MPWAIGSQVQVQVQVQVCFTSVGGQVIQQDARHLVVLSVSGHVILSDGWTSTVLRCPPEYLNPEFSGLSPHLGLLYRRLGAWES
jgi:hypothetical protein